MHALQVGLRHVPGVAFRPAVNKHLGQHAVLQDGQMREEVEVLKDHSNIAAHSVDSLLIATEK